MCEKWIQTDTQYTEEHHLSILLFSDYIQYKAAEIGKLAAPNTSFLHKMLLESFKRKLISMRASKTK